MANSGIDSCRFGLNSCSKEEASRGKSVFPSEATPYVRLSTKCFDLLVIFFVDYKWLHVNTQLCSALTKEEVDDDGVNSVAASKDPGADDVKVSNRSCDEEQIDNCDNGKEGMLVERDQVGRLSIGGKKGPEGKGNSA